MTTSKYKPGPLTKEDKLNIAIFQEDNNLKKDGVPGHQTINTLFDKLEKALECEFYYETEVRNNKDLKDKVDILIGASLILGLVVLGLLIYV